MKRWIYGAVLVVLVLGVTAYAELSYDRYRAIRAVSERAIASANTNIDERLVNVLCDYLKSNDISMEEKNRVIWVLGELRDTEALSTLKGLATSDACDHKHAVCQREVDKAIRKIDGRIPNPYFWQAFDGV